MENPRSRRTHDPISFISVQTTITGNSEKKRKDGGGGGLLSGLKFWRRKDKKTTRSLPAISQPSKFKHIGGVSLENCAIVIESIDPNGMYRLQIT